jgi:serine/threonine-protein kinase
VSNPPERLGKYPVTGVLGKGAMGVVYQAWDPGIRRRVAIKTIRRELIEDDEKAGATSARFRREAQAAGALSHPGIVAVYEYGEDAEYAFIAMEYVEGNTLREYLSRGTGFDERDVISVMAQLLDALEYAHANRVWHRDIKPANIIVMSNGRIKLTDFGIARFEAVEHTQTNVVMGTPGYIAPEYYLGAPIDQRIDIFSVGVLFYLLSARRPPFAGRPEAIMHDVCYHDPEPASAADPSHRWPQYDAIIARAIAKSPDERFESAAALRAAMLAEYARPVSSTISETTIISHVVRPIGVEPSVPSTPKTPISVAPAPSTPPPTGWSVPVLAGIEVELARFIGPVAKVLVRRAAKTHKDVRSLVGGLLDALERREDRESFSRAVLGRSVAVPAGAGAEPTEPSLPSSPRDARALTAQDVERATRLLAHYIGPIARVVARRAASGAGMSRREFFERVAQSIDGEAQRESFLRDAGAADG